MAAAIAKYYRRAPGLTSSTYKTHKPAPTNHSQTCSSASSQSPFPQYRLQVTTSTDTTCPLPKNGNSAHFCNRDTAAPYQTPPLRYPYEHYIWPIDGTNYHMVKYPRHSLAYIPLLSSLDEILPYITATDLLPFEQRSEVRISEQNTK